MNLRTLILLALAALPARAAEPAAVLLREFIYETAPFASCHASTLVETSTGLAAAWFGGTREGAPDVGIWLAHHTKAGWSTPVEVATGMQPEGPRLPCWNPVLFHPQGGPLLLFYKVGPSPSTWWGMLRTSADEGRTWNEAARLPEGFLGPIKNKPVQLSDGSILCPSSTETNGKPSAWRVHFERTADLGKTWTRTEPFSAGTPPLDAIQPSLLFLDAQRLLAVGRTRQGALFQTISEDGGQRWGSVSLTDLPNPNSGTDAVTLRAGGQVLIYNHTKKGRSPLNVAFSPDGRAWQAALVLEKEPGEYSYPAVIEGANGLLHFTYTWQRKKIRHVVVDPTKLKPQPIVAGEWPQQP